MFRLTAFRIRDNYPQSVRLNDVVWFVVGVCLNQFRTRMCLASAQRLDAVSLAPSEERNIHRPRLCLFNAGVSRQPGYVSSSCSVAVKDAVFCPVLFCAVTDLNPPAQSCIHLF